MQLHGLLPNKILSFLLILFTLLTNRKAPDEKPVAPVIAWKWLSEFIHTNPHSSDDNWALWERRVLNNIKLDISKKAPTYIPIFGIIEVILTYFFFSTGLHLGSILASVSPAVVVPTVTSLHERGLGTKNQIALLVANAGGLDTTFTEGVCGVINSAIFYPAPLLYRIIKVNTKI